MSKPPESSDNNIDMEQIKPSNDFNPCTLAKVIKQNDNDSHDFRSSPMKKRAKHLPCKT